MGFPVIRSKATAFVGLVVLLLVMFGGWVATSPEFAAGRDKPAISRWLDGAQARLRGIGIVIGRRTSTSKKTTASAAQKTDELAGPVSVVVQDNRNKPIPDVTVTFRSSKKTVKEKTSRSGRVDTKLPVGIYDLAFTHSKYSTEMRTHQQVYGPNRGFALSVMMQTSVALKGKVADEEGKPVVGATVSGQRNWLQQFSETGGVFLDDAAYPMVQTDAQGVFRLQDVSIGSNTFTAAAPGYATAEAKVDVTAEGLKSELKFVLKRPAVVAGRVVDEATQPVKGAKVTAVEYQPYGGAAVPLPATGFVTSTAADGAFELKKLFKDGYYRLKIEHSSFAVKEMPQVSADTTNLNVMLQRGGEISGRVQYVDRETTQAFTRVNAVAVVEGTTVSRQVMSAPTGEFAFTRLPYGAYELSVDFQGFVNEPRGRVASVRDRPSTGVLLEIFEASKLSGVVVDAFSGEPIPAAQVTAKSTYGADRARVKQTSVKAGTKGEFGFEKLPGGLHQVSATAQDYLPVSGNPADYTVPLKPGAVQEDYRVFLSKGGTVRGQVVNPDGNGIGEADVQLYVASGSFTGVSVKDLNQTTDGSGFFEFSGFPIGQGVSLYVSARKAGYAKKHSDIVELWPAQPESATQVVMTPGGVVSGRVTDEAGTPLYGVKITYDSREFPGDPSPTEFYTFSDAQGNYLLEHCTPGRAVLVAEHEEYVRQIRSATIPEGRLLSRQNFKLELARNISGTVADFRGNPIADAIVSAVPIGKAKGSGRDRTDKKGNFEIKGLGAGTFRLEASFTLDTADGKQAYVFILPEAQAGMTNVPIDCDVAPGAIGSIRGESGKAVDAFKLTLRSLLDTEPKQLFRFNIERPVKDAGGQISLHQVPRGIYSMKIEAPGYETWESEEVLIGPGNMTRLPNIRLKPASQITGEVVSATTGKPVQGALIRVLDDAEKEVLTVNRIQLRSYNREDILEYLDAAYDEDYKYDPDPNSRLVARVRGNVVTTLQTNVYGKFDINDLADGTYTLEVEHPAYRPKRIRNVHVGRKQSTDLGQIELDPGGTVRGRVVDMEGNGISNASVQVKGELQGRNRDRTDVGGNFVLRGIGFGEWPVVVQATLDGRKIYAWKRVSVRPDETSVVEFVLETSADLTGRLVVTGGVNSGTLRMYAIDEQGAILDDYVYSDSVSNGRFSISHIPPGRYFALTNGRGAKGGFAGWQWVDAARGRNTVDFANFAASLQGVAKDVASGAGGAGATVQVVLEVPGAILPGSVQNQLRLSDVTDRAGKFGFVTLQGGTYRVWAGGRGQQVIPVDAVNLMDGQTVRGFTVAVQGGG
jgi:protocatechuate 3,4-dioxygenase beta subunit